MTDKRRGMNKHIRGATTRNMHDIRDRLFASEIHVDRDPHQQHRLRHNRLRERTRHTIATGPRTHFIELGTFVDQFKALRASLIERYAFRERIGDRDRTIARFTTRVRDRHIVILVARLIARHEVRRSGHRRNSPLRSTRHRQRRSSTQQGTATHKGKDRELQTRRDTHRPALRSLRALLARVAFFAFFAFFFGFTHLP